MRDKFIRQYLRSVITRAQLDELLSDNGLQPYNGWGPEES